MSEQLGLQVSERAHHPTSDGRIGTDRDGVTPAGLEGAQGGAHTPVQLAPPGRRCGCSTATAAGKCPTCGTDVDEVQVAGSPESVAQAARGAVLDWCHTRGLKGEMFKDLAERVFMVVDAGMRTHEHEYTDVRLGTGAAATVAQCWKCGYRP